MKHISILVPTPAVLGSIEGPRPVCGEGPKFLDSQGPDPVFQVQLVGFTKEVPMAGGKYTVHVDALIQDLLKTDLIIIPALDGDFADTLGKNAPFIPWILEQRQGGAEVASLCVGAFMLAQTGLMNGRQCATHWMFANQFRSMFPKVNLVEDKILTDEDGLYSSGGAFSYLNLIIYLVEKFAGRQTAVFFSKAFQIDIQRDSQSPFIIFSGQKDHGDEDVRKAQEYIENNYQEKLSVDELASMLYIGRRNFERRFKKATSNTVAEYIQRVKIEAAKMSLESPTENVNDVMYKVGYTDTKAFRNTFKRITGMSPVQYRNRYYKATTAEVA